MPSAAERILDGVRDIKSQLSDRAAEIESARRIPSDLLGQLRSLGVFRMLVPRSYGGYALDAPSVMELLTELASADGATAWTVMIGSHAPLVFSMFPKTTFDTVYACGPDVIIGGSSAPRGTTERNDGEFRANGRWSLASGCQHADWLFGVCTDIEKDTGAGDATAGPRATRFVALPASDWKIVDTWKAAGLRGTGSHDIVLQNVGVAAERTAPIGSFGVVPPHDFKETVFVASHLQKVLHVAAVALGIAIGALEDIAAIGQSGKRRAFASQRLDDMPLFQHRLGRAEADVHAARAYLRDRAGALWHHALSGTVGRSLDIDIFQTATWVAETSADAVTSCFRVAGASAVYETSPMQRRLRDIHTLLQHVLVDESYFTGAGACRLGRAAQVPFVRPA